MCQFYSDSSRFFATNCSMWVHSLKNISNSKIILLFSTVIGKFSFFSFVNCLLTALKQNEQITNRCPLDNTFNVTFLKLSKTNAKPF
jgi:hypothetical protein